MIYLINSATKLKEDSNVRREKNIKLYKVNNLDNDFKFKYIILQ